MVINMKLKDLTKEEERIKKRLEKYKTLVIERIKNDNKVEADKFNQIAFSVKLSELNNFSLRVEDNIPALQFKNYIELVESATSFQKLYEIITDYKKIMHEKLRINTSGIFDDVLKEINEELK